MTGGPEVVEGRRRALITAACTAGGALLFVYVIQRTGVAVILEGVRRVGWGVTVILALAGMRFVLRTWCWQLCMPAASRIGFRQALSAFLAGDAVGSVTPLGLLASEPTKVLLTRHDLATGESVASLAAENLIYAASVLAMVGIGLVVLLATVPLPGLWQVGIVAGVLGLIGAAVAGAWLLRGTWNPSRGVRPRWRERLARVRLAVLSLAGERGGSFWRVFALDLLFHLFAVVEVYLTLGWLLGDASPTLAQAIVFEALNRVLTLAFKFVPFRIGVDEAASGSIAPLLAVNPAVGVSLAVVRKVRNLAWSAVGLAIVAAHPAKGR